MEQKIYKDNSSCLCDMQMIERARRISGSYQDFTSIGQDKCTFMLQKVILSIKKIYESDNILECMQAYLDTDQNSDELRKNILEKACKAMDWDAVSKEFGKSFQNIKEKQFVFFFLLLLETMTEGADKEMDYMRKVPMPSYGEYLGYGDLLMMRALDKANTGINSNVDMNPLQRKMLVSQWFNDYVEINTLEDLLEGNFAARTSLASMLRYPYYYHVWVPFTQLSKAKRFGFGWQNILTFRDLPEDCFYVNPSDMSVGIYGDEDSAEYQNELRECFRADDIHAFVKAMDLLTDRFYPKAYGISVPQGLNNLIIAAKDLSNQ